MNYKIIKDEESLINFIDWLPELGEDEIYYCALFARKKYAPELKFSKTDKTQLKRFTSDKSRLLSKIKQLEIEEGNYYLKGTVAPQNSLALYITVNPRSQKLASRNMLIKLARLVGEPYNGHNLHQLALSEIQRAKSKTKWVDFDLDIEKDHKALKYIKENLNTILGNTKTYKIVETRGGYHILVNPNSISANKKTWYNMILNTFECDVVGDNMLPIIGCSQGGFTPRFLK